jgi:hypothetical protein
MRPLVERLTRSRPGWLFVNEGGAFSRLDNGSYGHRKFQIQADEEVLGVIDFDNHWRTREVTYELINHRLRAKRQRSGATCTKDVNKAAKLVEGHYYGSTLGERAAKARGEIDEVTRTIGSSAFYELDRTAREAHGTLRGMLCEDASLRKRVVAVDPTLSKSMEALPALREKHIELSAIQTAYRGKLGMEVMLIGERVINVSDTADDSTPNEFTYGTAPKHIVMAIGMLKLMGEREHIPDIGVRIGPNTFFIMPPKETE